MWKHPRGGILEIRNLADIIRECSLLPLQRRIVLRLEVQFLVHVQLLCHLGLQFQDKLQELHLEFLRERGFKLGWATIKIRLLAVTM